VHLPAAGLGAPEFHGMSQPLQQLDHRPPGAGKEQVVIAADKERNQQGKSPLPAERVYRSAVADCQSRVFVITQKTQPSNRLRPAR